MANTLLTISMITREALRVLKNNLVFASKVNREYDDKFAVSGAKIGTTLNIRKPPRYLGRPGQALQLENAVEPLKGSKAHVAELLERSKDAAKLVRNLRA